MGNSRVRRRAIIALFLFLSIPVLAAESTPKQEFLKIVPGGAISLDLIVEIGYRFSDQVKLLRTDLDFQEQTVLEVKAQNQLGRNWSSQLRLTSNRQEYASPFFRQPDQSLLLSSRYSHMFATGTSFNANLNITNSSEIDLPPEARAFGSQSTPGQVEGGLALRQSLWRNRFGYATQLDLEAAALRPRALDFDYQEKLAEWFIALSQVYYRAWLAQKNLKANEERLKTQERLLKITRLSFQRGTAEQADVLNVESQVLNAKQSLAKTANELRDIWRSLIITLKLPDHFISIDPHDIPILKEDQKQAALDLCLNLELNTILSQGNPTLASLRNRLESLQLNQDAARNRLHPNLFAELGLAANGLDREVTDATVETLTLQHPSPYVAVGIEMNLDQYSEKASLIGLSKQRQLIELQLAQVQGQVRIDWLNQCREVDRLIAVIDSQKKVVDMNRRRQNLEEERFQLGRVDVTNVIIASNDLISAQVSLEAAEKDLTESYWKLKQLSGTIVTYIQQVVAKGRLKEVGR